MAAEDTGKDENGLEFPVRVIRKIVAPSLSGSQPDLEASALLAKATELFIEHLVHSSATSSSTMSLGVPDVKRHTLTYDDVAAAVQGWGPCDFLRELVPARVTGSVARQMRHGSAAQSTATGAPGPAAPTNDHAVPAPAV